jgi:predicted nucleic acid-binding protein
MPIAIKWCSLPYVALAETLDAPLLTLDVKLAWSARQPGSADLIT